MSDKYYNDAIIGNKNIRASFTKTGELVRLYYPRVDFRQFIDSFKVGVKINDSGLIYLHEDVNNRYSQEYIEDTNILKTNVENTYFKLKVEQIDFVMIKENVLVKKYVFKNQNKLDLNVNFLIHSVLSSDINNMISGKIIKNGIMQYNHDYTFSVFSDKEINGHRINDVDSQIRSGIISDKDYIGMSNNSAISYDIGVIKPGQEKVITIKILLSDNSNKEKIEKQIEELNKIKVDDEFKKAKKYWQKYVSNHDTIHHITGFNKSISEKIEKIYKRTILLFPLLQNDETGGVVAAIEADEERTKCGKYNYCWPRDSVFLSKAFDILGMEKETEKFYKVFCKKTQSEDGLWEQRFYTDGKLAPCWGYQIDETSSVIYGIYEHYKATKNKKFVYDNLKMCENAMKALLNYLWYTFEEKEENDIVKKEIEEETKKLGKQKDKIYMHLSYDLWEMKEGVHLYSLASIYAAFNAMKKMYDISKEKYKENRLKLEQINKNIKKMDKEIENIKKYINDKMYDEKFKIFYRNSSDTKTDVSIIGSVVPFDLFSVNEKKIKNTVEKINMTLRTYTGGYIRFENDSYLGGNNPWPIATLWMSLYYIKAGNKKIAKEAIEFVAKTGTDLGFLAEQVDNKTMQSNWVIGLGWSHAMFIIAIKEFMKNGGK